MSAKQYDYLLVGGYTSANECGIGIYSFDSSNGTLALINQALANRNSSYLCLDHSGRMVYTIDEQEQGGSVHAFMFDRESVQLIAVNKRELNGSGACHVAVDSNRKHLFVACYQSGSLSVFSLDEDGAIEKEHQSLKDKGSGPNKERQEAPHVHAACLSPDEKYLFYTDLGTDELHCYHYDDTQQAVLFPVSVTNIKPGSGPRQLAFSKNGSVLYLINELSAEIIVFSYHAGKLKHLQTISMRSAQFNGEVGGGDIQLSSDGLWLYASNRGDANELVVFSIDQLSGRLKLAQRHDCGGRSPRHLMLDPSGKFLLVANQESNNVVVFELESLSGRIGKIVSTIDTQQPACIKFVK